MHNVVVFGAGGYSGLELVKLLATRQDVRLVAAASDSLAGGSVDEQTGARTGLRYATTAAAIEACADGTALALLAVPHEAAGELANALGAFGTRIVDLSAVHRADPRAVYGLTSLFAADVPEAVLVANPGCYATAAITMLAPPVRAGLVEKEIPVSAASGVTGAGRAPNPALALGEMYGDMRAYKVLKHQHVPEIEAALGRVGERPRVILTTHLLPVARGIFATATARLRTAQTTEELHALYTAAYADDPMVTIARGADRVSLRRVVGTNQCLVGLESEGLAGGFVVVTAALDNLLKGAAGQAIENMNLMLGLPRAAGLAHLARHG